MKTSPEDMSAFWTDEHEERPAAPRGRPLYDVAALLARCGVGLVFLAHGWQKIQVGVDQTGHNFDAMGVPAPTAAAVYATFVELLGGTALILGVALPVAGLLLFLDMAGAFVFVHATHGVFVVDKGTPRNGFELVLVLGLASLLFAAGAGGRLTLDHRLWGGNGRPPGHRRRSRPDEIPEPSAPGASSEPPGGGRGAKGTPDTSTTPGRRGLRRKAATSPSPATPDAAPAPGGRRGASRSDGEDATSTPGGRRGASRSGGRDAASGSSGRDAAAAPDATVPDAPAPSGPPQDTQETGGGTTAGRPKRGTMGTSRDVRVAGPKPEEEPPAEGTPPKGTSRARSRKGPSAKGS
ncbi:DoxX family membrane protein [Actinoallomurus sp. NPDC050550]|uniref:DoxX family membrane protein n=1 Tax=Actinoallomurus sp. NPDC050550 TaxID=3154937 RepID=UPI00340E67A0